MARLKTAGKIALLAFLAFALALVVGLTPVARSYPLAVMVSVVFCPIAAGYIGGHFLALGAAATLLGINGLPVVSALDDALRLGDPVQARWLIASVLFSWAGWRLGRRAPRIGGPAEDMAK